MKVNTKTMTPIKKVAPMTMHDSPDTCFFNENKYLPEGAEALEESADEPKPWIRFIPTIFYTPVKTSLRVGNRRDTLSASGVDDLNKAFQNLLISDDNEEEQSPSMNHEHSGGDSVSDDDDDDDIDDDDKKLGRFMTYAESRKTAGRVTVFRSFRLN